MARTGNQSGGNNKPSFRILSIDGGGIRGILPGQILVALEKYLQEEANDPKARIADYFDLVAGTSTGGILACIYATPQPGTTSPRFSAVEAVDLYLERGDEVFDLSLWQRFKSGGGVFDEKYSADGLEDALGDYFEELKLSQLLKPCLITAYDIRRRKAHFFRSHAAKQSKGRDFLVKDVARATSAAPTFFEPARVKSMSRIPYPLIDGGLFANNPTLCAYAEARTMGKTPTAKDMLILSLGTGDSKKPYPYNAAKNWGALAWVKPVIDIMMSGVSETVDYQIDQIFDAIGKPEQYLRVRPKLRDASPEMDDASSENLIALRAAGQEAAEEYASKLKEFARKLVKVSGKASSPRPGGTTASGRRERQPATAGATG